MRKRGTLGAWSSLSSYASQGVNQPSRKFENPRFLCRPLCSSRVFIISFTAVNEIMKTREEHSGLQRNLGFSNFLEGWFTPWDAYEESEDQAPRVPLLRITPAFFKREVRFNYIYVDDEHKGEADVYI